MYRYLIIGRVAAIIYFNIRVEKEGLDRDKLVCDLSRGTVHVAATEADHQDSMTQPLMV